MYLFSKASSWTQSILDLFFNFTILDLVSSDMTPALSHTCIPPRWHRWTHCAVFCPTAWHWHCPDQWSTDDRNDNGTRPHCPMSGRQSAHWRWCNQVEHLESGLKRPTEKRAFTRLQIGLKRCQVLPVDRCQSCIWTCTLLLGAFFWLCSAMVTVTE